MDETPLQVLSEPVKAAHSKSYMWVMAKTQASIPIVLYHYSASRSGDISKTLLLDFSGALMVEGYATVCDENQLSRLRCWAHARRKLIDVQRQQHKGKSGKADIALGFIQKLYRIEKLSKDSSTDEWLALRQTQAKSIIDKLRWWLGESLANSPLKTIPVKAMQYLSS